MYEYCFYHTNLNKGTNLMVIANMKNGRLRNHHHKHQGMDPLICSVSRVTAACANTSSVF